VESAGKNLTPYFVNRYSSFDYYKTVDENKIEQSIDEQGMTNDEK